MDPPTQFQRGFMFPYLGKSRKGVTGEGLKSAGLLQQNIVTILLSKARVTEPLHCRGLTEGKKKKKRCLYWAAEQLLGVSVQLWGRPLPRRWECVLSKTAPWIM